MTDKFILEKIYELEMKIFELNKRIDILEHEKEDVCKNTSCNSNYNHLTNHETSDNEIYYKNSRCERFYFNGVLYKKSRLVQAVIEKYIKDHPDVTADELNSVFPAEKFWLGNRYSCVKRLNEISPRQMEYPQRYFVDEPIILSNGEKIAVCNQWAKDTTPRFIEFVNNYIYPNSIK